MLHAISGTMSHTGYAKSYDKGSSGPLEQDSIGIDPASGVFFNSDYRRHEDLKEMLDSNKDNLKLEAMKRIIGMVAKGRDASALFPAVVKNVVSKNIELKKLVYSYLERYAEEKEDLALLSISTFQRALKEPNQLIRAGALRVLSGIRVTMIAPIVMIAIRDAAADMSPYVRKTAAHAIPKLYSLDNDTKPELIVVIEKLLADRTVLVIGSAVMAFTKVCPERVDLIHKVYRKLCALLGDVDEWGQVIIVNMLTRYARTQFTDPCLNDSEEAERPFYESESEASEKEVPQLILDPDHRLLLRSARPLLQSRNAAVVMAVAQMYHHIGPKTETVPAVKALVRLLRSSSEVQELVLKCIVSMTVTKKGAFDIYLKSFFVRTTDSIRVKLLKLTILTNIASEHNISIILRELETYISSLVVDDNFVAATIQAIGRCACFINTVTGTCLTGLVTLLSSKNEIVVAESVVVIKRLLQTQAANTKDIIQQMIRLLDSIDVPQARASIIWLLGEHCRDISTASNVLKRAAKSFPSEQEIVKLQVLNLAVKLHIHDKAQYDLLCQYIFNLAKYDQNYDIRDRARLLKFFIDNPSNKLIASAAKIFLTSKPAPTYRLAEDADQFQLGSLSHAINGKAHMYESLPAWPKVAPPNDVRDVEPVPMVEPATSVQSEAKHNNFESGDSESSFDTYPDDQEEESSSERSSSSVESDDSKSSEDEQEEESSTSSEITAEDSSGSSSGSEEESEETIASKPEKPVDASKQKSNLDLLLDLEMGDQTFGPILTPSLGGFLTPMASVVSKLAGIQVVQPHHIPSKAVEVLNRINGRGLSVSYRYTRNPHLFSPNMVNINLVFTNNLAAQENVTDIRLGAKTLAAGMSVHEFALIAALSPNNSLPGTLGIDFNDSLHTATLEIISSLGSSSISIKPTVGELLRPITMPEEIFLKEQAKLSGMNEHVSAFKTNELNIQQKVYEAGNLGFCPSQTVNQLRFGGQTLTSSSLVLVTTLQNKDEITLTVNCEKLVIGSMLLNELKNALM